MKVVAAYRLHRSVRKVAAIFGIAPSTVSKIVKKYEKGVLAPVGGVKGTRRPHPFYGAFAKWIAAHPGVAFPPDLRKIAELTGCSTDSIKCLLYRLRKKGKKIPYLTKRKRTSSQRRSDRIGADMSERKASQGSP